MNYNETTVCLKGLLVKLVGLDHFFVDGREEGRVDGVIM